MADDTFLTGLDDDKKKRIALPKINVRHESFVSSMAMQPRGGAATAREYNERERQRTLADVMRENREQSSSTRKLESAVFGQLMLDHAVTRRSSYTPLHGRRRRGVKEDSST